MNKKIVVMIVTGIMIFSGFMILFSSNHNVNSVNPVNSTIIKPAITSYNPDITNVTDVLGATGISYDSAFNLIFVDSQFAHPSTQSYAGDITILNGSNYSVVSAPTFNNLIFQPYYNPYYKIDYNLESGGFSGSNFYYGTDAVANGVNDSQHFMTGTYDTSNHYEYLETNFNGTNQFIAFENTTAIASYNFTSQVSSFNMSYDSITNSLMTAYQNSSTYNLEIKENGLPSGTQWSYIFNGTSYTLTTNSKNYTLLNGTYSLSVSNVNGYTDTYPSSIIINGSNEIAYVNFTAIPIYKVTMNENGLPLGTSFTYDFNSVSYTLTNNSYVYELSNGTYPLSVTSVAGYNVHYSSSIVVAGATNFYINFTKIPTYSLIVKESGLSGIVWHIFLNGKEYNSSTPYNNVTGLTNGTYSFSVDTISGYLLHSYPSSFTINGANQIIDLTFNKNASTYNVNIVENGLANVNNIKWSIVFNGTTYISSNSNDIIIGGILNGSYSFKVNPITNYIIDKYNTTLIVKGNTTYKYMICCSI